MEHRTVEGGWERVRDAGGGKLERVDSGAALERLNLERVEEAVRDSAAANTRCAYRGAAARFGA